MGLMIMMMTTRLLIVTTMRMTMVRMMMMIQNPPCTRSWLESWNQILMTNSMATIMALELLLISSMAVWNVEVVLHHLIKRSTTTEALTSQNFSITSGFQKRLTIRRSALIKQSSIRQLDQVGESSRDISRREIQTTANSPIPRLPTQSTPPMTIRDVSATHWDTQKAFASSEGV